jgi:hypothetical protein
MIESIVLGGVAGMGLMFILEKIAAERGRKQAAAAQAAQFAAQAASRRWTAFAGDAEIAELSAKRDALIARTGFCDFDEETLAEGLDPKIRELRLEIDRLYAVLSGNPIWRAEQAAREATRKADHAKVATTYAALPLPEKVRFKLAAIEARKADQVNPRYPNSLETTIASLQADVAKLEAEMAAQ